MADRQLELHGCGGSGDDADDDGRERGAVRVRPAENIKFSFKVACIKSETKNIITSCEFIAFLNVPPSD